MTRIYILSNHDEDGSQNVSASLDPAKLRPLLTGLSVDWAVEQSQREFDRVVSEGALSSSTPEGSGFNLTDGWGGAVLHIVELIE